MPAKSSPPMQRAHYELIAETMRLLRPEQPARDADSAEYGQWVLTCTTLATRLADTNPHFDATRFLNACG
jgi:hypothetical protein